MVTSGTGPVDGAKSKNVSSALILHSEEYKNGELSTDFLKRYNMIERLEEDLKKEKDVNKETAVAAAVIHSEYFKSRVQNQTANDSNWKNSLG